MSHHADKLQETKSPDSAGNAADLQRTGEPAFQFADHRPEAIAQRKLQDAIGMSPKVEQLKISRGMADQYAQKIQRKENAGQSPGPEQHASSENRTGMPDHLKSGIESLSGMSMDHVQVHYNSTRPAQLNAWAYAQGSDIHLGPGQEKHLPHEAWHVVQQAQGRVAATMQMKDGFAVNDDAGLEHEADVMGAMALEGETAAPASAGIRQRKARSGSHSVFQLAAPGGIGHATNSCFVAALINTFTVVRPLRNLLIPANNVLIGVNLLKLQDLLWRAVNTVDATHLVPAAWVRQIMVSLVQNNILANAVDTADFSHVMAQVVAVLSPAGANGQANAMPVSTGEVAWYPTQTLETAVSERVEHLQNQANNFNLAPNSVQVTRGDGNGRLAPRTFDLYPADGTVVTYRLRSIVESAGQYVGGHFVSHVDRGDGAQEWWRSDDLDPGGVAGTDIEATGMRRQGYAYIYERDNSVLVASLLVPEVDNVAQPLIEKFYEENLEVYLKKEMGHDESESPFDIKGIDTSKYDKDTRLKKVDKDPVITTENVDKKIKEFNDCSDTERREIIKVNALLADYSRVQTVDLFDTIQAQMKDARETIRVLHERQAELLGQYMGDSSGKEAKLAFLQGIIPKFKESDAVLFDLLAGKFTQIPDSSEEDFLELRNRYLAYIVQGLGTETGKARLEEFGGLIGKRRMFPIGSAFEFGAGFVDFKTDIPKGQKQENRVPKEDQELLAQVGGNIPLFIERRFGKAQRTPGASKDETGDLMLYFEKYKELFPLYVGQGIKGQITLFSSPMFAAQHHETGHLINYLRGTGGGKNKYTHKDDGPLASLTDEDEVYNISVDRYSDKVLSGEMGLPERIAHKPFSGLTHDPKPLHEHEVYSNIQTWKELTGQEKGPGNYVRDLQVRIVQLSIDAPQFHRDLAALLTEAGEWLTYLGVGETLSEKDRQRLSDAVAWCFDQLEHKVYERMDMYQHERRSLIKTDSPEFTALGRSLDLIQAEHRRYIAMIIGARLDLWVAGSAEDKRAANQDWRALLTNKRGVRIEEESAPEFKNEMRANIAKLLSRKNGRKLIHALMSAGEALEIRTPNPESVRQVRESLELGGRNAKPLAGKELEDALNNTFGGQAGPTDHGEHSTAKDGSEGLERDKGSTSTMGMRTGLRDSSGISMDRNGKLILSPNFIELGHEMIHALHNLRGASVKGRNKEEYEGSVWDNMSERSVIEGTKEMHGLLGDEYVTENMLREDHNLGVRFGHNSALVLRQAIDRKLIGIAGKPAWDKLGGGRSRNKAPDGIVNVRTLLTQKVIDWKAVGKEVHGRAERNVVELFFVAVHDKVTEFYKLVDTWSGLRTDKRATLEIFRNFLDVISNFDPAAK